MADFNNLPNVEEAKKLIEKNKKRITDASKKSLAEDLAKIDQKIEEFSNKIIENIIKASSDSIRIRIPEDLSPNVDPYWQEWRSWFWSRNENIQQKIEMVIKDLVLQLTKKWYSVSIKTEWDYLDGDKCDNLIIKL